jgi:sporulation protein YlmC with PRC-barrel domain
MIRTLLATTALAALLASGAVAQDAVVAPLAPAEAGTEAGATMEAEPVEGTEVEVVEGADVEVDATTLETDGMATMAEPWDMSAGYMAADTDNLTSRLIDQPVYSSAGDDAEEIGNITDLVFTQDGQINAVVIGVGGFLGIGEKSVAVDFRELDYVRAVDNTQRWVLPTTADALNAAPDFVWEDDMAAGIEADAMMAPADSAMAPADPALAADPAMAADPEVAVVDPAMAPAADVDVAPMAMPREGYAAVEVDALTAENLDDATVIGPTGEDIAEVSDILLTADGQVDALLVDFGGFLGLGQKTVAVGMDNLEFAANENGDLVIYTDFTREQLEAAPEYDEGLYAADPALRLTDM